MPLVRLTRLEEREQMVKTVLRLLMNQGVTQEDIEKHLEQKITPQIESSKELTIPVSIFDNDKLSSFEAVVKYLHENASMRFVDIARETNRDPRAIFTSYKFAQKKMSMKFSLRATKYKMPLAVLSDRRLSVLENIASYLKKNHSLSCHEIALLLRRDDRTIWTVCKRAERKMNTITPNKRNRI
jgi:hypothetical protein